jgi:riboflavin kinase
MHAYMQELATLACMHACLQELGIPTANLSEKRIENTLSVAVTGIYFGWASVGESPLVHQMVMSVGYNPFYGNCTKTCEPWILHEFAEVCLMRPLARM